MMEEFIHLAKPFRFLAPILFLIPPPPLCALEFAPCDVMRLVSLMLVWCSVDVLEMQIASSE